MYYILAIIIYFVACGLVADIANQKNYSAITAFIRCLFITPFFMILYYGFAEKKEMIEKTKSTTTNIIKMDEEETDITKWTTTEKVIFIICGIFTVVIVAVLLIFGI